VPLLVIADDSMFQRFNSAKIAGSEGFDVLEAANGKQCLDLVETHEPVGMLLDLNMPLLKGVEVLERIRELAIPVKVAVVTADIQETTKRRVLELGAERVLYKPVDENELRAFLRSIK